jgi:CheY-like chemotaxis protein
MLKDPPEDLRGMLSEVEQAGTRAASLVAQLLTFGRKNAPKQATVELDYLVTRLLPLIRRMLGEHVHVEVAVEGAPLALCGDESQLEQVLLNLCVNARDAMPEGGRLLLKLGRIELETESALAQGLPNGGSYLFIDAIDTGCGMTEAIQRRIFEPFFTTKGAGSGIGLATVYAVAKRHGGNVEVRSQFGKGSQFRVLLRCSPEGDSARSPSVAPSRRSRTGRILLVEDDPSVRQVTRMFLERDGHQVLVAQDGVEAMSIIERESANLDLIVLDAIMPNPSGPEVYRRFRTQSRNPVLFVTGHGFNAFDALPEDSSRTILEKPFSASELSEAVQKLLARRSLKLKTSET